MNARFDSLMMVIWLQLAAVARAMTSNVAGKKRRSSQATGANQAAQLQLSQLDFSHAAGASPLLLVAAAAAAAAYSPSILHRQLLQQHLQQAQQLSQLRDEKQRHSQSQSSSKSRAHAHNGGGGDDERTRISAATTNNVTGTGGNQPNGTTSTGSVWPTSPTSAHLPLHKIRKLKLYSVDEKIDIIDYAKVIGNRAAGREFNVAESSIREWRKNEDRLR